MEDVLAHEECGEAGQSFSLQYDVEHGKNELGAMLWSFQEAVERQTLQIGASACGATAVVDVLQALGNAVAPETADRCVRTCLRRNEAPLPDYLLSRSQAGNAATVNFPPHTHTELSLTQLTQKEYVTLCVCIPIHLKGISVSAQVPHTPS